MAVLGSTAGWQVLKEEIEARIAHLQSMEGMIDPSSTVEQIGFKHLAVNIACFYLQAIINRVEGVKKFFEEEEEEVEKKK